MNYKKVFPLLAFALIFSLLMLAILASPALALTGTISIISPATKTGPVGTTVTLTCSGFTAGAIYTVNFNGVATSSTGNTGVGSFTATFVVPTNPAGSYPVTVTTVALIPDTSNTETFTITPQITLNGSLSASGSVGDTVTVNGTGFDAGTIVTITYNAVAVTTNPATVITGIAGSPTVGSFTATFTVPSGVTSTYTVGANDGTNSATAYFTVTTNITLSAGSTAASPGYVGMPITINGTGFKPSFTITITYASAPVSFTTTSLADGSFSYTFNIPRSEHGAHTITATDGTNSKQANFYMESNPPSSPELLLPASGKKAKPMVVFDWGDVTDDSEPVTYDFQVATDANFTTLKVNQTGLTASGYTLSEAEKLETTKKEAPYYWRVRAIDAASNASDWSSSTFYVGSSWIMYFLIGIGVVFVFIFGFFIGKRGVCYRE
jgi:hypothetical protein